MGQTHNRQHVFFVDDEPSVCKAVDRTLVQLDVKVSCFTSAHKCLASLHETRCDLLITDVKMAEMNGIELLGKAKAIAPWLPVLLVTGYGDIPTAVSAVKLGAADFIEKPLDRDNFLATVRTLLKKSFQWNETIGKPLTKTENLVLCHVLEGKSSKEIATCVHRSLRTVELHRQHIMRKIGVDNVVELVRAVNDMGLSLPMQETTTDASPFE
ncbi:response regulator transcription factor [Planctomycetota bacterium]